jgi:hypothetical protein
MPSRPGSRGSSPSSAERQLQTAIVQALRMIPQVKLVAALPMAARDAIEPAAMKRAGGVAMGCLT